MERINGGRLRWVGSNVGELVGILEEIVELPLAGSVDGIQVPRSANRAVRLHGIGFRNTLHVLDEEVSPPRRVEP